jgi:xanthine dehydrogenase iron-sulfur cluster and FAD-binding subunit A
MKIEFRTVINGRELEAAVKPNQTLLEWLRDDLRLRGSVEGCGVGVCGSCTVLVEIVWRIHSSDRRKGDLVICLSTTIQARCSQRATFVRERKKNDKDTILGNYFLFQLLGKPICSNTLYS